MIHFIKGIFYDLVSRLNKMEERLHESDISPEVDAAFFAGTIKELRKLTTEITDLIDSGDLDIETLSSNNIIRYNTFHESLLTIELFRYLIILNYGSAEAYFKDKINRIYNEIGCSHKVPLVTTISNSESYYWALPVYHVIAVPVGEEKNLLNLPDLYHEIGHLIELEHSDFLKGDFDQSLSQYFQSEMQRVLDEERSPSLIIFFREKFARWQESWIMEFTCDLIATFLVGPAYAWTNLKLTTLSSGKDKIYLDSASHPSDESRMRIIFYLLNRMGHQEELIDIEGSWNSFLKVTSNAIPQTYGYIFPQRLLIQLADNVYDACINIGLINYGEQLTQQQVPVSKLLNDAWHQLLQHPETFQEWQKECIKKEIGPVLPSN